MPPAEALQLADWLTTFGVKCSSAAVRALLPCEIADSKMRLKKQSAIVTGEDWEFTYRSLFDELKRKSVLDALYHPIQNFDIKHHHLKIKIYPKFNTKCIAIVVRGN